MHATVHLDLEFYANLFFSGIPVSNATDLLLLSLLRHRYKSRSYRSRAVRDPRGVLREFGTHLPGSVALVVHDSTADNR